MRYFPQLYRFFSNKCNEPDELVQATFFAIVKARDQFAGRSQFRTYLFTVARHELYRFLRELRRERTFDPDLSSVAEIITTMGTRMDRNENHRRLCAALRTLSVDHQTLLELHYWEGLDAAALGEIFGVEPGLIRTWLSRARTSLRQALDRGNALPGTVVSPEDLDTWVAVTSR
jgi:RNA polymerase sigma-70 factor (ECF subfamily)